MGLLLINIVALSSRLNVFLKKNEQKLGYLFPDSPPNIPDLTLKAAGTFYVLLNQVIPLGVVLLTDVGKIFYSMCIENDIQMYSIADA